MNKRRPKNEKGARGREALARSGSPKTKAVKVHVSPPRIGARRDHGLHVVGHQHHVEPDPVCLRALLPGQRIEKVALLVHRVEHPEHDAHGGRLPEQDTTPAPRPPQRSSPAGALETVAELCRGTSRTPQAPPPSFPAVSEHPRTEPILARPSLASRLSVFRWASWATSLSIRGPLLEEITKCGR